MELVRCLKLFWLKRCCGAMLLRVEYPSYLRARWADIGGIVPPAHRETQTGVTETVTRGQAKTERVQIGNAASGSTNGLKTLEVEEPKRVEVEISKSGSTSGPDPESKVIEETKVTLGLSKPNQMSEECVGEIQSSSYGDRVSLALGGKEYYGPYRDRTDCGKDDLAKVPCDKEVSVGSLQSMVRLHRDVGGIQSSRYGSRVRMKVGYKDYYGPYRKTKESAWEDLAKLNSEKGDSTRKKALLLTMKREVGARRGGRKSAAVEEGVAPVEEGEEVAGVEEGGVISCSAGSGGG